jgi:hypothetical protein
MSWASQPDEISRRHLVVDGEIEESYFFKLVFVKASVAYFVAKER